MKTFNINGTEYTAEICSAICAARICPGGLSFQGVAVVRCSVAIQRAQARGAVPICPRTL